MHRRAMIYMEDNMGKHKHSNINDIPGKHVADTEAYEYVRRTFVPRGEASQCVVSIYEIPPHKAAYPYHFHHKNEETFYIISGEGTLRTPDGEKQVSAGDMLFFPADESGAHKLTNSSDTEPLVYIDFDTANDIDVAEYPDSGKIGVWGKGINKVFLTKDEKTYYTGE